MARPYPHPLRYDFHGTVQFDLGVPTAGGHRRITLTAGVLDEQAREFFGRFRCHRLAAAMACLTGWPVLVVDRGSTGGEWAATHSAVCAPSGGVVDVFGEAEPAALVQRCQAAHPGVPVVARTVAVGEMPGEVLVDLSHLRGDRWWWARETSRELIAVTAHFARLVLSAAGYRPS